MTPTASTPLRQRMIEDMTIRQLDLPPKKWTGLSRSPLGLGWADVAQG